MKHNNRYDSLDPRAVRFVRHHARRLAQSRVKAAWDVEDYEQDLILDLLIRSRRFDEGRSSYATFADRVVRRRVATLFAEGASEQERPTTVPLDERDQSQRRRCSLARQRVAALGAGESHHRPWQLSEAIA